MQWLLDQYEVHSRLSRCYVTELQDVLRYLKRSFHITYAILVPSEWTMATRRHVRRREDQEYLASRFQLTLSSSVDKDL